MRRFIAFDEQPMPGQLLQLFHQDQVYRFKLLHAGIGERHQASTERRCREHSHDDVYHVLLFTEGSSGFSIEGKQLPSRNGLLVLTGPGQSHEFGAQLPGQHVYSEITFSFCARHADCLRIPLPEVLTLLSGVELAALPPTVALAAQQAQEIAVQFERILDWLETRGPLAALYTQQAIEHLLILVVRECYRPLAVSRAARTDCLELVRSYIEQHYQKVISVEALAARACFSKGHLLRKFRQRFGVSPIAYQQQLRVRAAMTLLQASAFSVGEIAGKVGYRDIFQFSRIFRKHVGQSPRAFRGNPAG